MLSPRKAIIHHWSNNPLYENPFIKKVMSRDAWFEIFRSLWFSEELLEPINNKIGEEEQEEEEEREINVPVYWHRPREDLKEAVTRV